jgi:hydrogenase/urease accessory protein HupE
MWQKRGPGKRVIGLLLCALCSLFAATAAAHPAPFSYLDVRLTGGAVSGSLVLHDLDVAHELALDPPEALLSSDTLQLYRERITAVIVSRLVIRGDGQPLDLQVISLRPLPDRSAIEVIWRVDPLRAIGKLAVAGVLFPYDSSHQTFVSVYEGGALTRQEILTAAHPAVEFYTRSGQGVAGVVKTFTLSGIHHIAIGPDHILFVVGLLLLGGRVWRLLGIVSAFTVGHSVTLSLATLGMVHAPAQVVEPLIALSIVYVGADNLLVRPGGRDVRPWIALCFGLVHGFGFASVLRETGLPPRALGWSLFAFNLGVEIGQAAIVAIVASALVLLRRRNPRLAAQVATAGSVLVLCAGLFWFVQRVSSMW